MTTFRQLNIGFNYYIDVQDVIAIVSPDSVPIKRLIQTARKEGRLVDSSRGRRTRAVIVTSGESLYLSCIQPETLADRLSPQSAISRWKKLNALSKRAV